MSAPLLEVRGLRKVFPAARGAGAGVAAVDGVDLTLARTETLALVGESGCGKSTMGRLVMRLLAPDAGSIRFDGREIAGLSGAALRALRGQFQMIFQDPFGSLNPRLRVADLVAEPLRIAGVPRPEARARAAETIATCGLGTQFLARYPHELSGGQRQRVGIARALVVEPRLVVADEPVSALDVSIQAQVINLMQDLQERLGLTYLFISHDLGIVHHIADRVAVMYLGRIVEEADKATLFARPAHPYTRGLLAAIPSRRPGARATAPVLRGEVQYPPPGFAGCSFAPRCPFATDLCRAAVPEVRALGPGHRVACHRAEELPDTPQRSPQ